MEEKLHKHLKRKLLLYSLVLTMAVGLGKCASDNSEDYSLENELEENNEKEVVKTLKK